MAPFSKLRREDFHMATKKTVKKTAEPVVKAPVNVLADAPAAPIAVTAEKPAAKKPAAKKTAKKEEA